MSCCYNKIPYQKQFKERWANAGSQFEAHSIMVEKTRHQEPAAASDVVSAVRKQRVMNSSAHLTFSTYTVQDPSKGMVQKAQRSQGEWTWLVAW